MNHLNRRRSKGYGTSSILYLPQSMGGGLAQYGGDRVSCIEQAMLEQAYFNSGRNNKRSRNLTEVSKEQGLCC